MGPIYFIASILFIGRNFQDFFVCTDEAIPSQYGALFFINLTVIRLQCRFFNEQLKNYSAYFVVYMDGLLVHRDFGYLQNYLILELRLCVEVLLIFCLFTKLIA